MSDAAELYAELIRERDGAAALTLTERCVARQLATLLADDTSNCAREVAALLALLPAPARKNATSKLVVEFVEAAPSEAELTPAQIAQLDSTWRIRAEIAESLLQQARSATQPAAGAPNGAEGTSTAAGAETHEQRRARAEAQAPIMQSGSGVDRINQMLSYGNGGYSGGFYDPLGSIYSRDPQT
jgi:hypothetical protein